MNDGSQRYLAQDNIWNGNGEFTLVVDLNFVASGDLHDLNKNMQYERVSNEITGTTRISTPEISAIIHCKCKKGIPSDNVQIIFSNCNTLHVIWPGVTRIFVCIRIMEAICPNVLYNMLMDDLDSGHSLSDVEMPERNQSYRPWSDDDDSETDTVPVTPRSTDDLET